MQRFGAGVQPVGVGRVGPVAGLVHLHDLVPGPERLGQPGAFGGLQRTRRQRVEADAGRQHQALLRAADGHVHAPFVMAVVGAGQARDGVHQQQGRVARRVDGPAHGGDVRGHARGGLVVHHAHGADPALRVLAQPRLDQAGLHAMAPARRLGQVFIGAAIGQELGGQAQARGHLLPQRGEVAGLEHQHMVARAERVDQGRLPGARAGGRIDHHRMPGLEDLLDAGQHLQAELAELRPPVVDGGQAHGPQDAVGNRAGAGDLEEVAARGMAVEREHGASFSRKCQVGLRGRMFANFCIQNS
ncbi:MAG: hypothetical protein GAK34_03270 [Delftia tsuruhatensis]|nr:MAG: hypothetical protein GAK34_03270 [Delftia tsuruhatensis]